MAEQLKIIDLEEKCLSTIRTVCSRLWFVNNRRFCEEILGYLAKYQQEYGIVIYHFILMGNHYHLVAQFPRGNRDKFMKVFNRIFSNAARRHVPRFEGGPMWARRYRPQTLPMDEDVLHWFFYSALNPISSGLVSNISHYPSYNSFHDSLKGRPRKCRLVNWSDYQNRHRSNSKLTPEDCVEEYELVFARVPGHQGDSLGEYRAFMHEEYRKRRAQLVEDRKAAGKKFADERTLRTMKAGSRPRRTKTSSRNTHRPLVLTLCAAARRQYLEKYFGIVQTYREASEKFRRGVIDVIFPKGTYLPPTCLAPG